MIKTLFIVHYFIFIGFVLFIAISPTHSRGPSSWQQPESFPHYMKI